jgi:DNA-binding NarL/FixJ family response regulator
VNSETLPACPAHGVRFVVPLDPEDRDAPEPTVQGLLELARGLVDALERMVNLAHKGEPGSPATVISVVALALGSTSGEVRGGHRYKGCVRARHAAALALRECGLSMSEIAEAIGVSDHTTVTNALVRARSRSALEPAFASAVQAGVAAWGLPRKGAACAS